MMGYDAVNYASGMTTFNFRELLCDICRLPGDLGVKRIVIGECGHASKAMLVIGDRLFSGDLNIPRESAIPLLEDLVSHGKLKLDPSRNNFPVTLHDRVIS